MNEAQIAYAGPHRHCQQPVLGCVGGPQPAEMARMIKASQQALAQQAEWIKARRTTINAALSQLDSDFEKLMKN
ncbi:MAG: hypothetical protein R3E56_08585 [Burkholderiaceae bacterium]